MAIFESKNPVLGKALKNELNSITDLTGTMTMDGAVQKTMILSILVFGSAMISWNMVLMGASPLTTQGFLVGGAIAGLILCIVISMKPERAPTLSPIYAIVEGLFLGVLSAMFSQIQNGIIIQAIILTISVVFGMLALYKYRIIQATQRFRSIVVSATVGIMLAYIVSIVLGFFGVSVPFIHGSGMIGIGFSLFVVGIAALNLIMDFDLIERGSKQGLPKYMEWYAAFGLMVTIIWLYVEILRLLSKLAARD